jgi:EAL domain-containing protein (putative c-di-GMP-specific phosphodiesterase class I)
MIKEILKEKSYGVEYQPFVSTKDEKIVAYEALSRFEYIAKKIPPDIFFGICHDFTELFFEAEQVLKKYQFRHRPKEKKLFVNFDPHILLEKERVNEVFNLFSKQDNFVIELVENSHEVVNTSKLLSIFKNLNYDFAVDDFFKENSMLSLELLKKCNYLKLDKDTLKEMNCNKSFIYVVEGLVKCSHELGKKIVIEGVESKKDFELAKKLNIDYVQGYLFRSEFIQNMYVR